jgi:hypothetical protein
MVTPGALSRNELDFMRALLGSEWAAGNVTPHACMRLLHHYDAVQHLSGIGGPQEPACANPAEGIHIMRRWAKR